MPKEKDMQYYTITEAAKELGLERHKVLKIVRQGQIESIKGDERRSPYKIAQTELKKLKAVAMCENKIEEEKVTLSEDRKLKPTANTTKDENYDDIMQMQKMLMETMRDLASTQEKIASTLAYLVKKL